MIRDSPWFREATAPQVEEAPRREPLPARAQGRRRAEFLRDLRTRDRIFYCDGRGRIAIALEELP
jgi:hypothetical protein